MSGKLARGKPFKSGVFAGSAPGGGWTFGEGLAKAQEVAQAGQTFVQTLQPNQHKPSPHGKVPASTEDNTGLYIGLGVLGVVIVGGILAMVASR